MTTTKLWTVILMPLAVLAIAVFYAAAAIECMLVNQQRLWR